MINLLANLTPAEQANPLHDFSGDLATVLGEGHAAYFPRRFIAGRNMTYRIRTTVDVPSGSVVVADPAALIQGPATEPLFQSFGTHVGTRIEGGLWTTGTNFWFHDGPQKNRTIEMTRFNDLVIRARQTAFVFAKDAIAVLWRNCRFLGGSAGVEFKLLANIIKFQTCRFENIRGPAVYLPGDPHSNVFIQRLGIRIANTTVRNCDRGLYCRSSAANVDLYDCRFEGSRFGDVDFELHSDLFTHNVVVRHCTFATPSPTQGFRMRTAGRVAVTASGNRVTLDSDPSRRMVFVQIEPPMVTPWKARTWLENNQITAGWSPNLNDVLFRATGPSCVQVQP